MAEQSNALMVMEGEKRVEREYSKGNWTLNETLVLITAKRMDDERRMKRGSEREGRSRPAEQRWKWVEDYCWRNGCLRSQNQCNDKWDNLMRDFKKVRDYERRVVEGGGGGGGGGVSYWNLEKHERKDRNLPTNLLPQIYDALVEVVEKRGPQRIAEVNVANKGIGVVEMPMSSTIPSSFNPHDPLIQQQKLHPSPHEPPPPPHPAFQAPFPLAQALPIVDSDGSEHSNSSTKRRRRGEASSSFNTTHELGSAISRSASIIERALLECEEKEERRHRELLSVEERKLKVEESKAEINRQAMSGLSDAINQLANSIFALVSDKNVQTPPK